MTPQEARNRFAALEQLSYERLHQWELGKQQRMVAYWVVRLSYGKRRGNVWLTGLLLSALTGLHEPDVTVTIGELQCKGVLHVSGTRRRARQFTFLPNGELLAPASAVDEARRTEVLASIEGLQPAAADEDVGGQKKLAITTSDEQLNAELESASQALALTAAPAPPTAPPPARSGNTAPPADSGDTTAGAATAALSGRQAHEAMRSNIEGALRAEGWGEDEIAATRHVPVQQLIASAHSPAAPVSETLISGDGLSVEARPLSETLSAVPYSHSHDSQLTGDSSEVSEKKTVSNLIHSKPQLHSGPQISETLTRPKIADPEMMSELRELVGEANWSARDERGKGNWGALWNRALRSSPVAWQAARQAIASYKTNRTTVVIGDAGAYMWRAFERIHRALLAERRRKGNQS